MTDYGWGGIKIRGVLFRLIFPSKSVTPETYTTTITNETFYDYLVFNKAVAQLSSLYDFARAERNPLIARSSIAMHASSCAFV
jgi:hypothetical protein